MNTTCLSLISRCLLLDTFICCRVSLNSFLFAPGMKINSISGEPRRGHIQIDDEPEWPIRNLIWLYLADFLDNKMYPYPCSAFFVVQGAEFSL